MTKRRPTPEKEKPMSSPSEVIDTDATHTALAVIPEMSMAREPAVVLAEAQKAAKALKGVIDGKPKKVTISGKTYLEFEDWLLVAQFYGLTAKVEWTRPCTYGAASGWEARAIVEVMATSQVIAAAESMCMDDEDRWDKRPSFQLRSMAQTRAQSKALASKLRWVVVLAGYAGTPAEEMHGGGNGQADSDGDPNTERGPRPASPGQIVLINTKAKAAGVTEAALHTYLYDHCTDAKGEKVSSLTLLKFDDVNAVLDWLTAQQKARK